METIAALIILFPTLMTVATGVGIDPVHFATFAVLNLMIGLTTPPVGVCLFVMRQHLLKENKIKETEITLQNIKEFSHFQLINSMNDFDDMFIYPIERIVNLPESREYLGI
jgi:TRAP-type mannitol/chloroaromatic compound transport system permease large subunit